MRSVEERGTRRTFLYAVVTSGEDNEADGLFEQPVIPYQGSSAPLSPVSRTSARAGQAFEAALHPAGPTPMKQAASPCLPTHGGAAALPSLPQGAAGSRVYRHLWGGWSPPPAPRCRC